MWFRKKRELHPHPLWKCITERKAIIIRSIFLKMQPYYYTHTCIGTYIHIFKYIYVHVYLSLLRDDDLHIESHNFVNTHKCARVVYSE